MNANHARRIRRLQLGLGAAYLLLAGLSSRAGDFLPAIELLYLLPMTMAALRLDRARAGVLAAVALVTHGAALFMLIESGHRLQQPAVWTQFGVLCLAYAWSVYAAGSVLRLRESLSAARRALHDVGEEARDRASRDALTGAYHRGHLLEALAREIARAERIGKPLSVARVDLDGLGAVNQSHGSVTGDIALKRFVEAATHALRNVDILGRYGGKEFLALMPDTDLQGAMVAAGRLRAAVSREPLPEVRGRRHLSCTLGVAEHRKGENTRLVLGRAEAALNYAKAAGRDRVVALAQDGKPLTPDPG